MKDRGFFATIETRLCSSFAAIHRLPMNLPRAIRLLSKNPQTLTIASSRACQHPLRRQAAMRGAVPINRRNAFRNSGLSVVPQVQFFYLGSEPSKPVNSHGSLVKIIVFVHYLVLLDDSTACTDWPWIVFQNA